MQSLYTYYDKYGKVLFSGVFNASLLLEYHTNAVKSKLLCGFVELCNFCVPMLDFFLYMASNLILLQNKLWLITYCSKKNFLDSLKYNEILKEDSLSTAFDHLPLCVTLWAFF